MYKRQERNTQSRKMPIITSMQLALVLDSAMTLRDNDTSRVPERL